MAAITRTTTSPRALARDLESGHMRPMDFAQIQHTIVDFVRQHEAWAPVITAALAFGESLAFLSLLVPATVMLVGIGALVGASGIDFWPLWFGAAIGAALGDWLSYGIGYRFKYAVFRIWPLSRRPDLIVKGDAFVSRWGVWGVFVGRFFGPARAVVPLIAGIFAMPALAFQLANFASAFLWAFVLLAPGAGLMQYLG